MLIVTDTTHAFWENVKEGDEGYIPRKDQSSTGKEQAVRYW